MPIAGWSFGPDAEVEEALLDEVLVEVIPLDVGIVFLLAVWPSAYVQVLPKVEE